jgi:phosphatidylglycerophosphate synthase
MSHNTWIHRIVRVGVRPLIATPVSPNHVTSLRLAVGIAAAGLCAVGDPTYRAWGAGLFVISVLLDRADGELARLADKRSPGGHKYDLLADSFCNAIIFVGVGWGLRGGDLGFWAAALGLVAGVAVAAVLLLTLRLEARAGARAGELGGVAGFDPDDAILFVPLLIWLGFSQAMIVAAAIGAPAFALFMAIKFRTRPGETAP